MYKDIIDYDFLKKTIVVANTPNYLIDNFRKNQSILDLSVSFTDQQLINFYYDELNSDRNLGNLATLYALIIALSLKSSAYVDGFFKNLLDESNLKWAKKMAHFYFNKIEYSNVQFDYRIKTFDQKPITDITTGTYNFTIE